uniref:Dihydrolipoamide acetyltransferase component of pyruvate dehydrogenase complex n=1 Tax=Oryza meridionalis TaxID=40149 RepID=A0A0E0FA99_9ORYZ
MAALLHLQSSAAAPSFLLLRRRGGVAEQAGRGSSRRRRACFRVEAKIREIFMPALSSTMTEGKIVSWTASEGDRLAKGDPVVVVESDKADMDVETFHDGFLAAVLVPAGESAPVGSAIALLAESEDEIPAAQSKAASLSSSSSSSSSSPPPPPQEATPPPPPPPPPAPVAAAVSAPAPPSPATQGGVRVVASPYARKLAKDLNVDLNSITGSGPGGRIVAKDVEAAAAAPKKAAPVAAARPDVPLGSTVPFTTMQGAVSKNMVESLAVPTFRVGYTFTTDALDALYKKIKPKGVTMSALLAKATTMALVQHPVINSSCRDGKSFTYNSSINIAVAVAIDGGLITPVLPDADKLDIYSLSRKWKELVDKARAKQLQPHEYNSVYVKIGSTLIKLRTHYSAFDEMQKKTCTFTISNLGMFGVDRFDAILPPGTGAIMAVGSSQPTLVGTKDGRIGIKNQMQVNVTADHRVIYGADLAAFLQTLSKIIEDPKDLTF